ncbi:MAG: hypothetical protein QXI24_03215 [Acidilobaceae archaeon]
MNPRILTSIVLIVLFIAPLVAPLTVLIPVKAQQAPLIVTSLVVTPNGELGFILNRTLLIAGHPVQGAPVLFAYLSKNAETILREDDLLIAELEVGTGAQIVFGTLLIPEVAAWFGQPEGNVYLKITSSKVVNVALAVVSDPFRLIVDPERIERALRVFEATPFREKRDFAYYENFGRANDPLIRLNLTAIGITFNLSNVDVFNVTLVKKDQILYAQGRPTPDSNFLVNVNYTSPVGGNYNVAELSGRIGEFTLRYPEAETTVAGVRVAYQDFSLHVLVANGTRTITGPYARVDKSRVVEVTTTAVTFNFTLPRVSVGWTKTFNIYPSMDYTYTEGQGFGVNDDDRINPGDNVNITLRNLRRMGVHSFTVAFFYFDEVERRFVRLPFDARATATVDRLGSVSFTVQIPANPYGGRLILATVNATVAPGAPWVLARNVTADDRIYPVFEVIGFDNAGFTDDPTFVPGEFIAIRGVGFLVEKPRIELFNVTPRVVIPLVEHVFIGVFSNGTFAAIVQIPPETKLYSRNSVILRAYTGDPARTFNMYNESRTVSLGTVRVFIEPRPAILGLTATSLDARIMLGATRFPSPATWEPEAARRFTLLVYGFPEDATRFNVSLVGPATVTLAINEPRTGVGSLLKTFPVPETFYGSYQVQVRAGNFVNSSDPAPSRMLNVSSTAAAFDPGRGVFDKRVFLPVPVNLTIRGFGFDRLREVYFDIPQLGLRDVPLLSGPAAAPTTTMTNERGSFTGWIDLPTIITTPGTYTLRIRQSPEAAEIVVVIGVPPPFSVKVAVSAAQFADLPVGVWVVAFYGGSIATSDQVPVGGVTVSVYFREDATTRVASLPVTAAVPGLAVYYASFKPVDQFGAGVKGREVLVVASATGRFAPIAPEDRAADIAVTVVPPVTFSEALAAVALGLARLEEISSAILGRLDALSAALGSSTASILAGIGLVRSDLADVKALLVSVSSGVSEANTKLDSTLTALVSIADTQRVVLDRLSDIGATLVDIKSGVAVVSTDVKGLATLLRSVNLSLSNIIVDESGRVRAAITDSEGRIVGAITANARTITDLLAVVRSDLATGVKSLSDAIAAFRTETTTRLDAIAGGVDDIRAELARARTDLAAAATVLTDIRGIVSTINTNLGTALDIVRDVQGKVTAVNTALPDIARKGDVSAAQSAIVGRIGEAQASIEGKVSAAQDAATTSSRNWGVINAILVIIAIAILAYSVFVRRP